MVIKVVVKLAIGLDWGVGDYQEEQLHQNEGDLQTPVVSHHLELLGECRGSSLQPRSTAGQSKQLI